jgi:hypothetical protein
MVRISSLTLALGVLTLAATAACAADQPPVIIYTPVPPGNGGLASATPAPSSDVSKRFPIVIQQKNAAEYPIRVAVTNPALFPIRIIQPGRAVDGSTPPALPLRPTLRIPLALTRPAR